MTPSSASERVVLCNEAGTNGETLTQSSSPRFPRVREQFVKFRLAPSSPVSLHETARYTYDAAGRMLTVQMGSNGNGTYKQTRTFVYNTAGQLTSATTPEKGTVTYTYYINGMLQSKTSGNGASKMLGYAYDNNNRLTQITMGGTVQNVYSAPSGGTVLSTFTYDTDNYQLSSTNTTGRMTSATNNGYTWHYSYDVMGRVNAQTMEIGTPGANGNLMAQAQYAYDLGGNLVNIYYPGALNPVGSLLPGQEYGYYYDLVGRPVGLQATGVYPFLAVTANSSAAAYTAAGQLQSWQEGTINLNRTYDPLRGWMTGLTVSGSSGSILNQSYSSYFANGQLQTLSDTVGAGSATTTTYGYDYLNRLASAANVAGSTQIWGYNWSYDDFGNRKTQTSTGGTQPGPSSSLTYDTTNYTNRIVTDGNNGVYTYDADGNLTAFPGPSGATSVSYDAFDRAVTITVASSSSTVTYDAFGRRIAKTFAGGMQRLYFYSSSGQLLAEYDNPASGNSPSRTTQYFAGQRVGQWTDRVGSKCADSSSSSQYYPYGEEITSTNNDTYKFAQTYRDSDSGLDYAVNRYYSANIGRFLTVDAGSSDLANPQRWNRYSYANNDPVNLGDSDGMDPDPPTFSITVYSTPLPPEYLQTLWFGGGYEAVNPTFAAPETPGDAAQRAAAATAGRPTLQGNPSKTHAKKFNDAMAQAEKKLTGDCAKMFGDGDIGRTTLDGSTYTEGVVFVPGTSIPDPTAYAATTTVNGVPTGGVTINLAGFFFNVTYTGQDGNTYTANMGTGLSDNDFRAFVLLHELGHLTGKLGDDRQDPSLADAFNKQILQNCFGKK